MAAVRVSILIHWTILLETFAFSWIFSTIPVRSTVDTISSTHVPQEPCAFDILAGNIAFCLVQSDLKRDSGFDGSSTGWTSWVEDSSAFRLQQCIDKLCFVSLDKANSNVSYGSEMKKRDDYVRWLRWMRDSPAPLIVELSDVLRKAVNETLSDSDLERVEQTHDAFLSRIGCRLILLPSGMTLRKNLQTEPGAMVYGKILYGGVTRYRLIGHSGQLRRAGERTSISQAGVPTDAWLQYGGPERNYAAIDMGSCALMEITILPKGLELPMVYESEEWSEMSLAQAYHPAKLLFEFQEDVSDQGTQTEEPDVDLDPIVASEMDYIIGLESAFTSVLGGLRKEVEAITRRVLDGRAMTLKSGAAQVRARDLQAMLDLSLTPVRGLLLYGPPGCGTYTCFA